MKIAFTICSVNYLAQAKTLGDTLCQHNPDYTFIIGLVDKIENKIIPDDYKPYQLLEVKDIPIAEFDSMINLYNIIELNTAVKPFFIEYFFTKYPDASAIVYFDPDIMVFDKLSMMEELLNRNNIVLTPHFFTPIFNHKHIQEKEILKVGLYNLGFIGVSRSQETFRFLAWWQDRLKKECRNKPALGLYVDQRWIDLVPLYFQKVSLITDLGFNAAFWNLHERTFSVHANRYIVNNTFSLVFYHFSSFNPLVANKISNRQTYYTLENRKDIYLLYENYRKILLENKYAELIKIPCYYIDLKIRENLNKQSAVAKIRNKLIKAVFNTLPAATKKNTVNLLNIAIKQIQQT